VTQAEFIISAVTERDFPREGIPEVVFAGRSNAGKSSLINRLAGDRKLARISAMPGKTQSINFYRFDRRFFFADLPGYGYTKIGKAASRHWKHLIELYFRDRPVIALAVQLVDARMLPTELDLELAEWLDSLEIPRLIVATKADKLSHSQQIAQSVSISNAFGGGPVIFTSSVSGAGCKEIWSRISEAVRNR